MSQSTTFPRELLKQSISQRLDYFRSRVFAHPRLVQIHNELTTAIRYPADASLIFVFGPTGVGKTTMRLRIEKTLVDQVQPGLTEDRHRVPFVSVEADAPATGNFSWRDYYRKAFLAMGEPNEFVERKMPVWRRGEYASPQKIMGLFDSHTKSSELCIALTETIKFRRPQAFLIDEGQHMTKVAGGRVLADHMDHLKSLANMTKTVHVLFGTYELATLARLSGQISRRSIGIHFSRYRADVPEDLSAFQNVLHTLQSHLPFPSESNLVQDQEFMYEICAGCVGTLKGWIDRAAALALEAGARSLSRKYIEQIVDPLRMVQIAHEIAEGERSLGTSDANRAELRSVLGLAPIRSSSKSADPQSPTPRKRRAFERKPVRDLVGVARD